MNTIQAIQSVLETATFVDMTHPMEQGMPFWPTQAAFEAEVKVLEGELKAMQEELQNKYTDYQERKAQLSELLRSTKEQEIRDLDQRIQTYQQSAQQRLQDKEKELLQPIIDRAKQAISDVAKENGYTYVFDTSAGALLYQQDSDDILPLVKKKLGLK